jgi:hypothetical protein
MKNEVSVFALMQSTIGNSLDHYLGLAGDNPTGSKEAYIQSCETRALLYRQLAKHCNEQAEDYDERVAEFAAPGLVVTAEEPQPAAPSEEPPL